MGGLVALNHFGAGVFLAAEGVKADGRMGGDVVDRQGNLCVEFGDVLEGDDTLLPREKVELSPEGDGTLGGVTADASGDAQKPDERRKGRVPRQRRQIRVML